MDKKIKQSIRSAYGTGFLTFIIFMILKLTGQLDWSWLWITSSLWIPVGIELGIFIICGIILLMSGLILAILSLCIFIAEIFKGKSSKIR